jgi:hypothetical protein
MIITGDLMQTNNKNNGLNDIIMKLNNNYYEKDIMNDDGIDIINLNSNDIQRSKIVNLITNIYIK